MEPFLQQVAKAILAEHGTALHQVAVVLPSQRAGLYLRKWLGQEAGAALWSPQLFTTGTFMEQGSGLRTMPTEELLFEAYEAYRQVQGPGAQPLGEFLQWATTALHDMSEADSHLVPLEGFYRDLRSWEELDWSFNDEPLSQGQNSMVRYWTMVGKMHAALNSRLLEQGAATSGLSARCAAEAPSPEGETWDAVWFVGLNAITPAEGRVIMRWQDRGKARMAWDADRYYLDDPQQEAGLHLRKAIATFGVGVIPPQHNLDQGTLLMRTLRAPNDAAQAWSAAEVLKRSTAEERARTALVLADEGLLQLLLEALPADIGPLNITMGLAIPLLPIGSFLDALHQLHAGMRPGQGFFHADVVRFLLHPFLRQGEVSVLGDRLLKAVAKAQRGFIPEAFLHEELNDPSQGAAVDLMAVFTTVGEVRTDLPQITLHALSLAQAAMKEDDLATEQIYQAALILRRVHLLLQRYPEELDLGSYRSVMQRLLRASRIGLFGEPLMGAQIMGMLEARALDHERIIVLGAQEGSLPSGATDRSFIPFELRRAYGLPLRDGNDAVQAYNFLRMLQRAEHATVIWSQAEEAPGKSRFIMQLEEELFKKQHARFTTEDVRIGMPVRTQAKVKVEKDAKVIAAMQKLLADGLSPSAIGDWLRCPLDFHFKRILHAKETEEVQAQLASNVLGQAVHKVIERCYSPWLGKPLQAAALFEAAGQVEERLLAELAKEIPAELLHFGQPLLRSRMAVHALKRYFLDEAGQVKGGAVITPLHLEMPLKQAVPALDGMVDRPVSIVGRLDRVDRCNGALRVLDIKTGSVKADRLKLKELSMEAFKGDHRYAAQLLIYAWLYLAQDPDIDEVQVGILPLQRAASSEPLLLTVGEIERIGRSMMPEIEAVLGEIVATMLDPLVPIVHDPESTYCNFCLAEA